MHHWNDAFDFTWFTDQVNFFGHQYCTLESNACFNLNRCRNNPRNLYIYPHDASKAESFFRRAGGTTYISIQNTFQTDVIDYLTNHSDINVVLRPDEACLFLQRVYSRYNRGDVDKGFSLYRLRSLPHWDNGRNHIIVDLHDDMYHRAPADRAMFTRCSTHKNVLWEGFDVQTLNIQRPVMMNQSVATEKNDTFIQRPLLVSFKGSRSALVRDRLAKLNNSKDVVILVQGYPHYDSWDYMNLQDCIRTKWRKLWQ